MWQASRPPRPASCPQRLRCCPPRATLAALPSTRRPAQRSMLATVPLCGCMQSCVPFNRPFPASGRTAAPQKCLREPSTSTFTAPHERVSQHTSSATDAAADAGAAAAGDSCCALPVPPSGGAAGVAATRAAAAPCCETGGVVEQGCMLRLLISALYTPARQGCCTMHSSTTPLCCMPCA